MDIKDIVSIPIAKYLVIDMDDSNRIIMTVIRIKEKNGIK